MQGNIASMLNKIHALARNDFCVFRWVFKNVIEHVLEKSKIKKGNTRSVDSGLQ